MKPDLPTLVFILGLTCLTEVIAISSQYVVNKIYRGIGWWLLGSMSMALGFILLPLDSMPGLGNVSVIGIPLLVLGHLCFLIGIIRFLGKKEKTWMLISSYMLAIGLYYYFMFGHDSISARTIIASGTIALLSFLISFTLLSNKNRQFAASARFNAIVFLVFGSYLIVNCLYTVFHKPLQSYLDYSLLQTAAFIIPVVFSSLWTFGFILMVNQRLSTENCEEKENLQRVFNTGPDAALISRLEDGACVDANLGFLTMTGYSRVELLENPALGTSLWQDSEDRRHFVAQLKEKGSCENQEFTFRRKDGSTYAGMISARSLTMDGIPHIISVTRDITEHRRAEAEKVELEAKNRQLQKAESLGRMAGAIAHHFNNQLQSVMSNLELASLPNTGIDPVKCLSRAKLAAERAARVSHQMLVYLGQASSELEPCFLSELCRPSLQGPLPGNVRLETALPSPGPIVNADAAQIQQVLGNLITNAWEALGDVPGTIGLGLRVCSAEEIPGTHRFPINWQARDLEYACLEVKDSGCGMAAADIEKAFDPFFTTKFTGRGLGLPVVLGIVQSHGGVVSVESRPGEGSVFRVHLPICAAAEAPMPVAQAQRAELVCSGTLLLVDDDRFLLECTGAMIERMGFTLLTAKDGVEAVEVFRRHRDQIRCVITDLTMPRMDGWETLTALRQLEPSLPVILASGYDKSQVMAGAHPHRPQVFLGKPFSLRQLQEALTQVLQGV